MVLFLGGGGDIQDSIEIDTAFFSHLMPNDKILYIPIACDFTTYENCFVWFNSLVKKYTNIPSDNITMLLETSDIPNLNDYKAIYIGGGNTYKLLDYICKNNLDIKFKEYLKGSGIIFGGSAGAIIFGKTIETVIEEKENYPDNPALNMVKDYAIRCHYQPQDDKLFQNLSKKIKTPIIALPENGGLKIDENNIKTIGNVFIFNNGIKNILSEITLRKKQMHNMSVKEKYYNLLKSGKKTIELRLFDEKRQKIKIGDIIEFSNASNTDDTFSAKVINLHKAPDFKSLCSKIAVQQAGFSSQDELLKTLEEFYSIQRQKEFGVVGIEIKI